MTLLEARERSVGVLTLARPEVRETVERLSEHSTLKLETVKHPEIGMAGAVAHWGRRYPKEEIESIIKEKFGQDKVTPETGFDELHRVPPDYTPKQIVAEEMRVVQRLVEAILALNGWKPKEVEALFFGGSPLSHPDKGLIHRDYGGAIAQETGMTHLDPEKDIFNYYLYCNAGGRALREALTRSDLEGKKVLILTIEGLTRQMREFSPQKSDALSPQVFSDGAAGMGVVPKKNLRYLLGESGEMRDKGALAAVEPYQELINREGDLIQVEDNIEYIQLPQPPEGMHVRMHGGLTAKMFLRNVPPAGKRVFRQHQEKYPGKEIKFVVAHHPSKIMKEGIERRLELPIPWVVKDGNSSGATTLIAFLRLMKEFSPGDHVMIVSFGAGISWDVFVVEIRRNLG